MSARYVAFVRHEHVSQWESLGWLNTGPLPGTHGHWSCCLVFLCDCKASKPQALSN